MLLRSVPSSIPILSVVFLQSLTSVHLSIPTGMTSTNQRPPVHYRPRANTTPCGGLNNIDNGCQMVFARIEPGAKLCYLCVKLQDPANSDSDIAEIRVCFLLSAFFSS